MNYHIVHPEGTNVCIAPMEVVSVGGFSLDFLDPLSKQLTIQFLQIFVLSIKPQIFYWFKFCNILLWMKFLQQFTRIFL